MDKDNHCPPMKSGHYHKISITSTYQKENTPLYVNIVSVDKSIIDSQRDLLVNCDDIYGCICSEHHDLPLRNLYQYFISMKRDLEGNDVANAVSQSEDTCFDASIKKFILLSLIGQPSEYDVLFQQKDTPFSKESFELNFNQQYRLLFFQKKEIPLFQDSRLKSYGFIHRLFGTGMSPITTVGEKSSVNFALVEDYLSDIIMKYGS